MLTMNKATEFGREEKGEPTTVTATEKKHSGCWQFYADRDSRKGFK